jgi:hypothetical protein
MSAHTYTPDAIEQDCMRRSKLRDKQTYTESRPVCVRSSVLEDIIITRGKRRHECVLRLRDVQAHNSSEKLQLGEARPSMRAIALLNSY